MIAVDLPGAAQSGLTWGDLFTEIDRKWPRVPQMTTDELRRRLALPAQNRPLVIDVRSRKEFNVSHLPAAVWAESPAAIQEVIRESPAQRPVVLYCSVGIRSSRAAARLLEAGRTNVFNLKGSIFQWANERRPLEKAGRPVTEVHPYNQRWGRLLDQSHHPKEGS